MNTEARKPFKLVIVGVGRGEYLSPQTKMRLAVLLGEHPDMEIIYKDVSRAEDWVDERAVQVFEVRVGDLQVAFFLGVFVDHGHRRLGQNRQRDGGAP